MEKLDFLYFLGKFVRKNRNFGNIIVFVQQFFPVRGGAGVEPPNPLRTPRMLMIKNIPHFRMIVIIFGFKNIK